MVQFGKKLLSVVTVKFGYKDETKLVSTEKYFDTFFIAWPKKNVKKSGFKNKITFFTFKF